MDRKSESAFERGFGYLSSSPTSAFLQMLEKAKRFASYDGLALLILGETGTGKTVLARQLHGLSPRCHGPFVEVDCTSFSPSLVESELFGHVKGAFTGAVQDRQGRVRRAQAGTLFLDEIGELDLPTQSKLLKTIEEKFVVPVGAEDRIPVDLRVIVATNRDLDAMVKEGSFRRDLFERIRQAILRLPPLRERKNEIPVIVERVFRDWNAIFNETKRPGPCFMRAVESYNWPGNIRELVNAAKHACALSDVDEVLASHLPEAVIAPMDHFTALDGADSLPYLPEEGISLKETLSDIEWGYYQAALRRCGGNTVKAAELLDISGHTFRKALRERFARRFIQE